LRTKFALIRRSSQFAKALPDALMKIAEPHFQDAFRDGNASGFLNRLRVILKEKPSQHEGRS
jgi:hypothetical protein